MPHILIYSTPTCGFCKLAKAFFKEHNAEYEERDVTTNPAWAEEMIQKSGQMGVPFIVVTKDGKEEHVVGFDKPRLTELLGIATV